VPSVLAYLLYNVCVDRLGPARAGLSIHLIPVFGAILSVLLLGEPLQWYHMAGMLLIFSGIICASLS
jgi:drug/metabolite transporter (DMT)-like permease